MSVREVQETHKKEGAAEQASTPNPRYKNLPLELAIDWQYGTMINLSYPGLQLVHLSSITQAPIFIVNNFLSDDECDVLMAKTDTVALEPSNRVNKKSMKNDRTSWDVRVAKEETWGLQRRLATLTNHRVENMEPVKIIKYTKGGFFLCHSDAGSKYNFLEKKIYQPSGATQPVQPFANREITVFIYLNNTDRGGETAFYNAKKSYGGGERAHEYLRLKPEKGMAAVFYATYQPLSGNLPPQTSQVTQTMWHRRDGSLEAMAVDDMWHAGLEVFDEKYLLTQWIYPPNVDVDRSFGDYGAVRTDGRLI